MVFFSTNLARPLQLATRVMQWSSAVIVMGLTSFFINHGPRGQHTIYQEVIVCYCAFFDEPIITEPYILTKSVGCPLSRLLPPGFYFTILALVVGQIRARHRRCLLLPVC